MMLACYRAGLLPREAATTGHSHLIDLYKARRLALMNLSPNFLRRIRDESPSVFATTTVRPAIVGALGRTHVPVMLLSVTTQSDAPDLAAKLAAHMTSAEAQLDFCRLVNILPSTAATLDDPHFNMPSPAFAGEPSDRLLAEARALSAGALRSAVAFVPAIETWPDLRRAFEDRIKRVLLDDAPLDEALAAINRDWNAILAAAAPADMTAVPTPEPIASTQR